MNRQKESLKRRRSVVGNRLLRAHKRDVERKIHRDNTLSRHRNLSAMSPLKENVVNIKAGQKTSQQVKGTKDASESRKEMLQKWKTERELKKKLQQREQGNKPAFRVSHIVPESCAAMHVKPLSQRKHFDTSAKAVVEAPVRRVTRASIAAAKPPAQSTRSSGIPKKVLGPSVAKKRPSTRPGKPSVAPEAAPTRRSVRSREQAPVPTKTATSKTSQIKITSKTSQIKTTSKTSQTKTTRCTSSRRIDERHITQGRSESASSFAPDNFEFAPPAALPKVVFKPLSPVSAHTFMFSTFNMTTESGRVDALLHSPMVEVRRRTPKVHHTPGVNVELPNFDDVDLSIIADPFADISTTCDTAVTGSDTAVTGSDTAVTGSDTAVTEHDTIVEGSDKPVTGIDLVVTGSNDAVAGNKVVTARDAVATASDVVVTASDVVATASDAVVTASDAVVTASDAVVTASDAVVTASDAVVTASDAVVTASDAVATEALARSDVALAGGDVAVAGGDVAVAGGDVAVAGGDVAVAESNTATMGVDAADMTKVKPDDDVSPEHGVSYFRELLVSETKRLTVECDKWDEITSSTDNLLEEDEGQIRTTVGQAQLLMRQRFKQFSGLVDNCEFGTGEKATLCTDLQGFWDMIYFQVEDVDNKFEELSKLRNNNWVKKQKQQPKKKKVLKKPAVKKPVVAAKSKFGAFLAKMKQQKTTTGTEDAAEALPVKKEGNDDTRKEDVKKEDDAVGEKENMEVGNETEHVVGVTDSGTDVTEEKTFDGGFFQVSSPVHSPLLNQKRGSSVKKSLSQSGSKGSSRVNTPGSICNSRNLLLMSVMKRLSQSAQRLSSSPQLSGGGDSQTPRITRRSVATTPSGGSTGRRWRSRRSLGVCLKDTESFDGLEGVSGETHTDKVTDTGTSSVLSRFLVPTKLQESEDNMEVDQPISVDDVDMSAQMKRSLSSEFDRQSLTKLPSSPLVTPKQAKSAMKRRRSATQASGRRSSRRSVRFTNASDSPACERLPVTPFNKNSRVPRKRSNSSTCHNDSVTSPTLSMTPVEQSDNDTPVRKLARLTVKHTPVGRALTPMTALTEADEDETCGRHPEIRSDLMSFSPLFTTSPIKNLSTSARTPNRTPRRSARLSLL